MDHGCSFRREYQGSDQGLHVDKLIPYLLKDRGYQAKYAHSELFHGVPVDKMSDLIARISNDRTLELLNAQPASQDSYLDRTSFNVASPIRYECQMFGLEAVIPNVTAQGADAIFDYAARQGQIVYEKSACAWSTPRSCRRCATRCR